jgi:hypothetical protein
VKSHVPPSISERGNLRSWCEHDILLNIWKLKLLDTSVLFEELNFPDVQPTTHSNLVEMKKQMLNYCRSYISLEGASMAHLYQYQIAYTVGMGGAHRLYLVETVVPLLKCYVLVYYAPPKNHFSTICHNWTWHRSRHKMDDLPSPFSSPRRG